MKIAGTQFTLKTKSFEIYVSGCAGNPHCKGCHNPETWDFDIGDEFDENIKEQITNKINSFSSLIQNIMIFGGEPLDQKKENLIDLLSFLSTFNKKIWLFTRYEKKEIPYDILSYLDYVKCGRYIPELSVDDNVCYGIKLATSNQKIYKLR